MDYPLPGYSRNLFEVRYVEQRRERSEGGCFPSPDHDKTGLSCSPCCCLFSCNQLIAYVWVQCLGSRDALLDVFGWDFFFKAMYVRIYLVFTQMP